MKNYKKFINEEFGFFSKNKENTDNSENKDKEIEKQKFINFWKNLHPEDDAEKEFLDYWEQKSQLLNKPPLKKRMVTVYTTLKEIPEKYKIIIDELLHNCDNKKLNKVGGRYYYGDYKTKLFAYKIGKKGYLGLYVSDPENEERIRVYDEIYELVTNTIEKKLKKIDRIERIRNHYDAKAGGSIGYDEDDAVKVGWADKKQQEKRWDVLLDIGFKNGDSILDFGCGIGDLYGYMKKKYKNFTYYGVDVNHGYIKIAKEKYPDVKFKVINDILDISFNYDWFIASGVFTVYNTTENLKYYIKKAFNQCKKGSSFNLIKQRYYPNIDDTLEKRRGYSKKVVHKIFKKEYDNVQIVDEYLKPDKEFTVYIYKNKTNEQFDWNEEDFDEEETPYDEKWEYYKKLLLDDIHIEEDEDSTIMHSGTKKYTKRELYDEISNETGLGKKLLKTFIKMRLKKY